MHGSGAAIVPIDRAQRRPGEPFRPAASVVRSPRFGDDWWRRGVVYQVYPRSFADADGDGVGDLPGIIDHLDHLGPDGLGVDAIWLSPIYPSPGRDVGYDVADHASRRPAASAPRPTSTGWSRKPIGAGIRIVLDLVMNHTSDQHPWFAAVARGADRPVSRDWYLWRDPAGYAPRRDAAAAQQLGVVLRRSGLDLGAGAAASSTSTPSWPSSRS